MLRRFSIVALAIAGALSAGTKCSLAQTSDYPSHSPYSSGLHTSTSYPQVPPSAPQHHASTLQEGVLRGRASVMQAYYNGQMSLAQARILLAEARARESQLRVVKMQAAQQRRQLVAADRIKRQQQKLEAELLGQQINAARMPLRYREYRLSPYELDRQTGEIVWPLPLEHPMFADDTRKLESLFTELAVTQSSNERYLQFRIDEACQKLRDRLQEARSCLELDNSQYQQYVDCQRYILGLKYEAKCGGWRSSMLSLAAQ